MKPLEIRLPYFSSLLSLTCTSRLCFSHAEWFAFPSLFLLPPNLSQTFPQRLLEYSAPISHPLHTHYPHNPTPCSFGFPLIYTLSFTDPSLRIKSFGPSLTQCAPPNYLCKRTPPTACCVSWAPSGHSIVNPQYSREGCWIPRLPSQRIHKVATCHCARQETKAWCLACFPCRPPCQNSLGPRVREFTVLSKWLPQGS